MASAQRHVSMVDYQSKCFSMQCDTMHSNNCSLMFVCVRFDVPTRQDNAQDPLHCFAEADYVIKCLKHIKSLPRFNETDMPEKSVGAWNN